jgi:hypothetical protein
MKIHVFVEGKNGGTFYRADGRDDFYRSVTVCRLQIRCPCCQEGVLMHFATSDSMPRCVKKDDGNALAAIQRYIRSIRCGDAGCIWGRGSGLHTNGGCQCQKMSRDEYRGYVKRLAADLRSIAGGEF